MRFLAKKMLHQIHHQTSTHMLCVSVVLAPSYTAALGELSWRPILSLIYGMGCHFSGEKSPYGSTIGFHGLVN